MKILRSLALFLSVFTWLSCHTGDVEPIVIDLSAARTQTPVTATPTPPPSPTAPPVPTPPPAPSPTPAAKIAPSPTAEPKTPATPPEPAVSALLSPEAVAERRLTAYNNRDLEPLLSLYAANARIYDPPDRLQQSGIKQIRQAFSRRFASPDWSRIESSNRETQGNFVVERESESGPGGQLRTAIVVSEIREGKIVRVWIFR